MESHCPEISKRLIQLINEEHCPYCDELIWVTPDETNHDICPACGETILCCSNCIAETCNPCPFEGKKVPFRKEY